MKALPTSPLRIFADISRDDLAGARGGTGTCTFEAGTLKGIADAERALVAYDNSTNYSLKLASVMHGLAPAKADASKALKDCIEAQDQAKAAAEPPK